jgi:hypothetical protein
MTSSETLSSFINFSFQEEDVYLVALLSSNFFLTYPSSKKLMPNSNTHQLK